MTTVSAEQSGASTQAARHYRLSHATCGCFLLAAVVMSMAMLGHSVTGRRCLVATGTIEAKEIPVASRTGGRIKEVLVQEGALVRAGQALVELDLSELDAEKERLVCQLKKSEARLLQLLNGPRHSEVEQAEAVAAERFFSWKMLENGSRPEEIAIARADRKKAESELEMLEHGYRHEEIGQAKARLDQTGAHLEWAEKDCKRYSLLAADGAVSGRDADEAQTKLAESRSAHQEALDNYKKLLAGPRAEEIEAARESLQRARQRETMTVHGWRSEEIAVARNRYRQAMAALQVLKEGARSEEITQAESEVGAARAAIAQVDALLRDQFVKSPTDAEVTTMDLHAGQVIAADKPIAKLTRLDEIWTRVYIPERQLAHAHVGQRVSVKVDAYPDEVISGMIVQIPGVAEFTPRNVQTPEERAEQAFGIKVAIDNSRRLLRGGMNAEVQFSDTAAGSPGDR